jgi:hypothetical protein
MAVKRRDSLILARASWSPAFCVLRFRRGRANVFHQPISAYFGNDHTPFGSGGGAERMLRRTAAKSGVLRLASPTTCQSTV